MTNITIPKKVVEQALDALCDTETPAYRPQYGVESLAIYDLRRALDQCEAEDSAKSSWAKTIKLAKVALHEMPRPHTDWMEAARAVCESVVKVGHSQEHEQEPVAEVHLILPQYHDAKQAPTKTVHLVRDVPAGTKLYTHPQPKRQPLTAEQIERDIGPDEGDREAVTEIVRQVERAHHINHEGEEA